MLGVWLTVVPGLLAVLALRPGPELRLWPETPALAAPAPEPTWDVPASESLALLRETTVTAARFEPELAACEASAERVPAATRPKTFRKCAFTPLSRMDGFGSTNGRMLMQLARSARDECRERVLSLGGMNSSLGSGARATLRSALGLEWNELLAESKTLRAVAREAMDLARDPELERSCAPLPESDRAAADESVA